MAIEIVIFLIKLKMVDVSIVLVYSPEGMMVNGQVQLQIYIVKSWCQCLRLHDLLGSVTLFQFQFPYTLSVLVLTARSISHFWPDSHIPCISAMFIFV